MSKPYYHALSSVKRYGGVPEDYLPIHDFMDSSKGVVPDNRHRALTHNSWFISTVIERVFGTMLTTSEGRKVSTRQIAEEHVLEDFQNKFIPAAADYLSLIEFEEWMNNGKAGVPNSHKKVAEFESRQASNRSKTFVPFDND